MSDLPKLIDLLTKSVEPTPSWALGVVLSMTNDVAKEFKHLNIVTKIVSANCCHIHIRKCDYSTSISTCPHVAGSAFCDSAVFDRCTGKQIESDDIGHKEGNIKIQQPEVFKNHLQMLFTKLPEFTPSSG
jgi:hypothetical protein